MKKRIIAIAAGAIVLVGMALGVVGFKGEAKVSVTSESSYTTEAGITTTNIHNSETTFTTDAGATTKTSDTTLTSSANH